MVTVGASFGSDDLFPLKVGDDLFVDGPNAKPIPDMQFKFDIVLNESGIVEGEPLIKVLQTMIDSIDSLVPMFQTLTS